MPPQKRIEKEPPKNNPHPKRAKRGTAPLSTVEEPPSSPPLSSTDRFDVRSLVPYGKQPVEPSIARLLMTPLHSNIPLAKYVNQKAAKLFQIVTVGHPSYLIHF